MSKKTEQDAVDFTKEEHERLKAAALNAFKACGTLAGASSAIGKDRRTLKHWIQNDLLLKAAFQEADEELTDTLETAAVTQALAGSERLLIHLLASRRQRYAHKSTVVIEPPTLEGVIAQFRQAALAQPVLAPMLRKTLQAAIDSLPLDADCKLLGPVA